jgi:hypothetical protein
MSKYLRPGFKRYRYSFGHPKLYRQLRDIPINYLSDDQFNYVVKSLLYAAMGYYEKKSRGKRRSTRRGV